MTVGKTKLERSALFEVTLATRCMRGLLMVGMLMAHFGSASATSNSVAVLTRHNDPARTGANLLEVELNTDNVNSNQFGLVCTRAVDDEIYAQPLIMTDVEIAGEGSHNVVVVATVNDSVYAFDADDFTVNKPYWHIVQSFQVTPTQKANNIHSSPTYWEGPNGAYIYVWGESDYLRQYELEPNPQKLKVPEKAHSPTKAPVGMPGGFLSISAQGKRTGTGILWGAHPLSGDANHAVRPGILHAYDAEDVGRELWNSEQNHQRDSFGNFSKFCAPTVANGKVYMATFSKKLCVYGLLKSRAETRKTAQE